MAVVERTSVLAADADRVFAFVTTATGVNDELWPWMRMTVPRGWRDGSLASLEPGVTIGRSWILLFGILPVDADDLTLAEVGPHHFVERSPLLSAASWQHERTVTPAPHGCQLTDRLTFEPRVLVARIPGGKRLHTAVIAAIFRHRHRRLVRRFGRSDRGPAAVG